MNSIPKLGLSFKYTLYTRFPNYNELYAENAKCAAGYEACSTDLFCTNMVSSSG